MAPACTSYSLLQLEGDSSTRGFYDGTFQLLHLSPRMKIIWVTLLFVFKSLFPAMEVTGNGKHWVCIFRHLSNWILCLSVLLLKPGHFGMLVVLWKWASQSEVLAFQRSGCHRGIITLLPSIAEQLEIWSPPLIFRLVSGKTSWGVKCLNDFCKWQTVSGEMDWKML